MILDWGSPGAYVVGPNILFGWQGGYAGVIEAPPAPPPVAVGGGYFPALVKPQAHRYVGVVLLGRLRVGGKVVFFRNRAQEEDEEVILLLELL